MKNLISTLLLALTLVGCSTSTYIKLPENSVLKIKRGDQVAHQEGKLVRPPLSWSSAGGIPYKIEKNGEVIQEGKMRAKFRPASIFWPPAAMIYWPIGFRQNCYDFTSGKATECTQETVNELK